jgi:hypothetical protein
MPGVKKGLEPSVDDRPISENERQEAFGIIQSVRATLKEIAETRALRKTPNPVQPPWRTIKADQLSRATA